MERRDAVKFILNAPIKWGRLVGFDKLTSLHNSWIIEMVNDGPDATLQAHRESYKTTCVSLALSSIIITQPSLKTMFMRKTDDDVKEVVKQVKKILQHPCTQSLVYDIYGDEIRLTVDNSTELSTNLINDTKGTSQLTAYGTGASITGKHYDRIFTDDIVNLKDRTSRAERERIKTIYQELLNVKNIDGRIFNTGTPWHKDDAFSIMPDPVRYDVYSTGIMSKDVIEAKKAGMESSLFAANYELRHIASEDVLFDSPVTGGDPAMCEQGIRHLDAAYGGSDSTAFTVGRRFNGKIYIFGKLWHKHVDDCREEIKGISARFNAGKMWLENNGDKGYLGRDLRNAGDRVVIYHEDMNKFVKITSYIKPVWRDVVFVEGTDPEYIDQVCDYNENAEHDDAPDSLACIIREICKKKEDTEYVSLWGVK